MDLIDLTEASALRWTLELHALRSDHAGLKVVAEGLKLLRLLPKANFNPDQPRVPEGNPDGGRWTSGAGTPGGSGGEPGTRLRLTITPERAIGDNGGPPLEEPPTVPTEKVSTGQKLRAVVRIAQWAGRMGLRITPLAGVLIAVEAAYWIYHYYPWIEAYLAAPEPLSELQSRVATPQAGTDVHHIVEQEPARADGFPEHMIEAPENRVRISRLKHWELNYWYATANTEFGGLSPRAYLRGKDWETRMRVGRAALVRQGILTP